MYAMAPLWKPGQQVIWIRTGGGQGYAERVPATVVRVTLRRVEIEVRTLAGQVVRHRVTPEHLQAAD
jgi:hypothetical protein